MNIQFTPELVNSILSAWFCYQQNNLNVQMTTRTKSVADNLIYWRQNSSHSMSVSQKPENKIFTLTFSCHINIRIIILYNGFCRRIFERGKSLIKVFEQSYIFLLWHCVKCFHFQSISRATEFLHTVHQIVWKHLHHFISNPLPILNIERITTKENELKIIKNDQQKVGGNNSLKWSVF